MLGSIDQFEHILRNNVIDEVLVTLPIKSFYSEIEKILSICENMGIEMKLPTDFLARELPNLPSAITTITSASISSPVRK